MKCKLLTLCLLTSTISNGQTIASFQDRDYPTDKFIVKKEQRTLGTLAITITHAKPRKQDGPKPFTCRTWLTIKDKVKNKLIAERAQDLETVRNCSGLFFSDSQPGNDLILLSKVGDNHGRFYMVNSKGKLQEYSGETFFVSSNKKYLFSNYYTGLSGVSIVDLEKNELIYTGESKQFMADWYFHDGQYFTVKNEDVKVNAETELLVFDFNTKSFTEKRTREMIDPKNKLPIYINDYNRPPDCSCGK